MFLLHNRFFVHRGNLTGAARETWEEELVDYIYTICLHNVIDRVFGKRTIHRPQLKPLYVRVIQYL